MATRTKTPPPSADGAAREQRFLATLGSAPRARALGAAAALDLDRLPDADGQVRLLLTADDARRLLEQGFEVHLSAALPVAALPRERVMSDAQARHWLEGRLKGLPREKGVR